MHVFYPCMVCSYFPRRVALTRWKKGSARVSMFLLFREQESDTEWCRQVLRLRALSAGVTHHFSAAVAPLMHLLRLP